MELCPAARARPDEVFDQCARGAPGRVRSVDLRDRFRLGRVDTWPGLCCRAQRGHRAACCVGHHAGDSATDPRQAAVSTLERDKRAPVAALSLMAIT